MKHRVFQSILSRPPLEEKEKTTTRPPLNKNFKKMGDTEQGTFETKAIKMEKLVEAENNDAHNKKQKKDWEKICGLTLTFMDQNKKRTTIWN